MADKSYAPTYWAKYGLEPPVQFPVADWVNDYPTLVDNLRGDIRRLAGEEYRGEDGNRIMQQIKDAEDEWERLAKQHVDSQAEHYGSRPVVRKPIKPFSGMAGIIQRARGGGQEEDRPLNP